MKILKIDDAVARVQKFRDSYDTHKAAAKAAGCTEAQMSHALRGKGPICPSLQAAAGIKRVAVYVDTPDVPAGFTHD